MYHYEKNLIDNCWAGCLFLEFNLFWACVNFRPVFDFYIVWTKRCHLECKTLEWRTQCINVLWVYHSVDLLFVGSALQRLVDHSINKTISEKASSWVAFFPRKCGLTEQNIVTWCIYLHGASLKHIGEPLCWQVKIIKKIVIHK